jgi:hypothetical protein
MQSFFYGGFKMSSFKAAPAFAGRHNTPDYYKIVSNILRTLRGKTTLRTMADHLNGCDLLTPSGMPWTRTRVADYIRNNAI